QSPVVHLPQADRRDHGRDHHGRRGRHLAAVRFPDRDREHEAGHARDEHRPVPRRRRRLVPPAAAGPGRRVHGADRRPARRRRMPLPRPRDSLCAPGGASRPVRARRQESGATQRRHRRARRHPAGAEDRRESTGDRALLRQLPARGGYRRAQCRRERLDANRAGDAAEQEPAVVQGFASADGGGRGSRQLRRRNARRICAGQPGRPHPRLSRGRSRAADRQGQQPALGPGDARRGRRRNARRPVCAAPRAGSVDAVPGDHTMSDYTTNLVEQRGAVTLVTLNRPQALNALNSEVLKELIDAFGKYDAEPSQRCLVLTGSEKAFAAGADIKEMEQQLFADMYSANFFAGWEKVTATRKPWLAAVAGYALGGGCEVAMMADFIIAADSAKFGQPEIKLGVTPGMGGSQRMAHAVGKAKAMEMCLTGRIMDAVEAERSGLVAKVVPAADLLDEALKTAEAIAAMPPLAAIAAKEMINAALELPLAQGIRFERRLFHGLFGTEDQKEGMAAFVEKRPGNWKGKRLLEFRTSRLAFWSP